MIALPLFYFRDGPLGPLLFADSRNGELHINAAVWFASDDTALNHASANPHRALTVKPMLDF